MMLMDIVKGKEAKAKLPSVLSVRIVHGKLTRKRKIVAIISVAILFLAVVGYGGYCLTNSSAAFINSSQYQAIFTTNNQAYFGKMQRLSDGGYRMTNVYYLQQSGNTSQRANTDNQTPQLVKMGSELHGPEDAIVFDKHQVLFWENLKSDSKVSKAIDDYRKK